MILDVPSVSVKYQLGIVPFGQTFCKPLPGRILTFHLPHIQRAHPAKRGLLLDGPAEAAQCRRGPEGRAPKASPGWGLLSPWRTLVLSIDGASGKRLKIYGTGWLVIVLSIDGVSDKRLKLYCSAWLGAVPYELRPARSRNVTQDVQVAVKA